MFEKLDGYDLVANLVPGAALAYALHFSEFRFQQPIWFMIAATYLKERVHSAARSGRKMTIDEFDAWALLDAVADATS